VIKWVLLSGPLNQAHQFLLVSLPMPFLRMSELADENAQVKENRRASERKNIISKISGEYIDKNASKTVYGRGVFFI
jgi:hypothetical protein